VNKGRGRQTRGSVFTRVETMKLSHETRSQVPNEKWKGTLSCVGCMGDA
jgi:hypothetical protein